MVEEEEVYNLLGGDRVFPRKLASHLEWDEVIRSEGVPWAVAAHLKEALHLSNQAMAEVLGVAVRTFTKHYQSRDAMRAPLADRVYRTAAVMAQAEEVLGSASAARQWLTSEQRGLGYRVPVELLATEAGTTEVRDLLGRIEYGVIA